MECVKLKANTTKILGIHSSYNRRLQNDGSYGKYIMKVEKLLKLWTKRQLTIDDESLIFHSSYLLKNFLFHSNWGIKQKIVKKLSKIYQKILPRWGKFLSFINVASQFLWYNKYIETDNKTICNRYFSQINLNHIGNLFENNGNMRSLEDLRAKLDFDDIRELSTKSPVLGNKYF